ncbi:MAG: E3 binding domain-containing protein [Proteobacteria bacterium]|nr:E3 binding domain-containing protein [Pseudomonadota bacterium]
MLAKPPVRKLAKDLGVELSAIAPGSGDGGIITREDVRAAAAQRMVDEQAPAPQERAAQPAAAPAAPAGHVGAAADTEAPRPCVVATRGATSGLSATATPAVAAIAAATGLTVGRPCGAAGPEDGAGVLRRAAPACGDDGAVGQRQASDADVRCPAP